MKFSSDFVNLAILFGFLLSIAIAAPLEPYGSHLDNDLHCNDCSSGNILPFGASLVYFGETYYELYVTSNGFISLGCDGSDQHWSFANVPMIAPYMTDLDTRLINNAMVDGTVFYRTEVGPDADFDNFVYDHFGVAFLTTYEVVATYDQVKMANQTSPARNTFQAVVYVSAYGDTAVCFNYPENGLNWPDLYSSVYPLVGFYSGPDLNIAYHLPGSGTVHAAELDEYEGNFGTLGQYCYIISRLEVLSDCQVTQLTCKAPTFFPVNTPLTPADVVTTYLKCNDQEIHIDVTHFTCANLGDLVPVTATIDQYSCTTYFIPTATPLKYLNCPKSIFVYSNEPTTVDWTPPTLNNGCYSGHEYHHYDPNVSLFGIGTTSVRYTAYDVNYNAVNCYFDVTVQPYVTFIYHVIDVLNRPITAASIGGTTPDCYYTDVYGYCSVVATNHFLGDILPAGYYYINFNSNIYIIPHPEISVDCIYKEITLIISPPGFYRSSTGDILPCEPGSYSSSYEATECFPCTAGTYNPDYYQTSCEACPASFWSEIGATECFTCYAGYYLDIYSAMCQPCPSGTFSCDRSLHCTPCPIGSWSNPAATECSFCNAGYYLDLYSGQCLICPTNTYSIDRAISCTPCPDGSYAPMGSSHCSSCHAGYYLDIASNTCQACPEDTFSTDRATECTPCPPGSFAPAGSSECTFCTAGYYVSSVDDHCICSPCPEGTYSSDRADHCTPCPTGSWSMVAAAECYFCSAGYYLDPVSHDCLTCPGNTFSSDRASFCTPCPDGSFSFPGASFCTFCAAGFYFDSNTLSCTLCPDNTFSTDRATECTPCPDGSFSFEGSTECTFCHAGYYLDDLSDACVICPANTYSCARATECTPCPAGSFSFPGSTQCVYCEAGFYFNDLIDTCDSCPAGTYSHDRAVDCTPCPSGYYSQQGSSTCFACVAGFYLDLLAGQCLPCPAGFTSTDRALECTPIPTDSGNEQILCLAGHYLELSTLTCLPCPANTYSAAQSNECTPCPAGSFSSPSSSQCTFCSAGSYLDIFIPGCLPCPANTFSLDRATECIPCQFNYYSPAGSAVCYACPAGTIMMNGQCSYCPTGTFYADGVCVSCSLSLTTSDCHFCPGGHESDLVCSECEPGYYSPDGRPCIPCPDGTFSGHGFTSCVTCPTPDLMWDPVLEMCVPCDP